MSVPTSLGVPVLTLNEARALITSGTSTGLLADDLTVQRYVDAATAIIERVAGHIVVKQVTKTWSGGVTSFVLPWKPLTAYDMVLTENGVPLTNVGVDFDVDGDAGILYRGHWPATLWFYSGRNNISFTCYVGRDVVPGVLKDAVAEQFRVMWQGSQQSPSRPGLGAQIQSAGGPAVDPLVLAASAHGILPGFA